MLSLERREIAIPARRMTWPVSAPAHLWQLALGWVLLIPTLYIAVDGVLIPRTGDVSFVATGEDPGSSASHKVSLVLFGLTCLVLIALRFAPVLALGRRVKMLLAFPILAILSFAWSVEPWQSVISGVVLLIFTLFAIYVGSRLTFQRQFELIMLVGAVALPVSIALAILVPSMGMDSTGWRGILVSKQNCSAVCTLWLITALHWKCSGISQTIFRAIYIAMCALLIVMSQSRTGWALALVALLLSAAIWLLQRMPAKQSLAILLLGLAVAAVGLYGIYIYAPKILTFVGKDATLSQRTTIWAAAWQAVLQHPILGYGFAAFWRGLYGPSQNLVLIAGWGLAQAQDGFLDVWLGIGLVGVVVIAVMAAQAMGNAFRCVFSERNQAHVRWCIVVIVCTLLYNIGESSIGIVNIIWFFFLLAATGVNQVSRERV